MISSRYSQSKKKKRVIFSRKKLMRGGQIVPVNSLSTYVYVNITVTGSTVVVRNITNTLVQNIATTTPGSVVLSVDPSLSMLQDYTMFGYNGTVWTEIPRNNLDTGGNSVALYGNVPGMLLRKQSGSQDRRTSMEVSIPVPVTTYGNVMQFVNISTSIFGFTLSPSAVTYGANMYIQLVFNSTYSSIGTKISGWIPTYANGLSLWLNGSEPGTGTFTPNTGVLMTNWADKSGLNNHATTTTENAPMYQFLPGGVGMGMYFNGSKYFSGNMKATGNYSYTFAVARPDIATPQPGRLLSLSAAGVDDSTSKAYMGISASSAPPNFNASAVLNRINNTATALDSDQTKPYIISAWADGKNICVAINGTLVPTNQLSPTLFNITSYMVGKNSGTTINNYKGYIYEIVNFNSMLYPETRRVVEGYLAWKWSLNNRLPSTHLYYTKSPTKYSITIPWPRILSDLKPLLWIDAQDPNGDESFPPADRSLISTWYDKSGNGNNLVAPEGSEPMYRNNAIGSGSIVFNRYPYRTMSAIPMPTAPPARTAGYLPTSGAVTPTPWVPGFGGFTWPNNTDSTISSVAFDNYGFLYIASAIPGGAYHITQYDEINVRSRMLQFSSGRRIRGLCIGPKTGSIYVAIEPWGPVMIIIPNTLPFTSDTGYSVFQPRLYVNMISNNFEPFTNTSQTCGAVVDKNENIYVGGAGLYRCPPYVVGSNRLDCDFIFPQVKIFPQCSSFYSPINNSISYYETSGGPRSVMYLDTVASFKGHCSGTTLTVTLITSGKIVLGSLLNSTTPVKIVSQTSGTPGGIGEYVISVAINTPRAVGSISGTTLNFASAATLPATILYASKILYTQNLWNGTEILNNVVIVSSQVDTARSIYRYTISSPQAVPPGTELLFPINMSCVFITGQIDPSDGERSSPASLDGILRQKLEPAKNAWEVWRGENTISFSGGLFNNNGRSVTYDPIGNYLFFPADTASGTSVRIKRINLHTGQVTTIAGCVNNLGMLPRYILPVTNEVFPVTSEQNGIFDTLASNTNGYIPFIPGKKDAYFILDAAGYNGFAMTRYAKITNYRATSSCMSGPLSLKGNNVSVFIVYLNINNNRLVMPLDSETDTPIISLSTNSDLNVFIGGIYNMVLTVTSIISGKIELGATINTPLGGCIIRFISGTGGIGTYNVSIGQTVDNFTRISASNGMITSDGPTNFGHAINKALLAGDTTSPSYISVYANLRGVNVHRNNNLLKASTTPALLTIPGGDGAGIATFVGSITTVFGVNPQATLTVTSISSGLIQIGAILNLPGNPTILSWGGSTYGGIGTYSIDGKAAVNTSSRVMTATVRPVIPDLLFFSSTASSTITRLNGGAEITTGPGSSSPFDIRSIGLGLQPFNISKKDGLIPTYFFDGAICEMLVYNTDLSTDPHKLPLMEGYLAWKWGIQNRLPKTHMYKSVRPTDFLPDRPTAITSPTVSRITDYSAVISWAGGNNAITYTYDVVPPAGQTLPSTFGIKDEGLASKRVTIFGLNPRSTYTVTIKANSTLASTLSAPVVIRTKYYNGTLWAGRVTLTNPSSIDTFTGPATLASFFDIFGASVFDKYNNLYLTQANLAGGITGPGIRVITPAGIVQTIRTTGNPSTLPTAGHPSLGGMCIDNDGNIFLAHQYYIYKLTPSQFPFVMDATNRITTIWTISIFAGTGAVPPARNTLTGLTTTVPININSSLFLTDMKSAFVYDPYGNIRPVKDNGDGTYSFGLGVYLTEWLAYFGWRDSANIYIQESNRRLFIYNILTNTVIMNNSPVFEAVAGVVADSVGNIYVAYQRFMVRVMMVGIDLNDMDAVNAALFISTPFMTTSASTLNVTIPPGIPSGGWISFPRFDNNDNLYLIFFAQEVGYSRVGCIYKFVLMDSS